VREFGKGQRFLAETAPRGFINQRARGQDLHCDVALQARIVCGTLHPYRPADLFEIRSASVSGQA